MFVAHRLLQLAAAAVAPCWVLPDAQRVVKADAQQTPTAAAATGAAAAAAQQGSTRIYYMLVTMSSLPRRCPYLLGSAYLQTQQCKITQLMMA
jgi:hypothetical protein